MTFKKRFAVLKKSAHCHKYIPSIIIHTIVEPSEDGPKEMGAFAEFETSRIFQRIESKADETQGQFENRTQSQLQLATETLN